VIWGPFLLALALGLLVSAGLYFAYLWPQVEPEEPASAPSPAAEPEKPPPAESTPLDEHAEKPAPDKPADEEPEQPPPTAA